MLGLNNLSSCELRFHECDPVFRRGFGIHFITKFRNGVPSQILRDARMAAQQSRSIRAHAEQNAKRSIASYAYVETSRLKRQLHCEERVSKYAL